MADSEGLNDCNTLFSMTQLGFKVPPPSPNRSRSPVREIEIDFEPRGMEGILLSHGCRMGAFFLRVPVLGGLAIHHRGDLHLSLTHAVPINMSSPQCHG